MNFQIHQNTPGPKEMYMPYSDFAATTNSFEQTPATSSKCFLLCDNEQLFSPHPASPVQKRILMPPQKQTKKNYCILRLMQTCHYSMSS